MTELFIQALLLELMIVIGVAIIGFMVVIYKLLMGTL
jgi:hypothetical protein